MAARQFQFNFPDYNPMHPFKRKRFDNRVKKKAIIEEGLGGHPDLLHKHVLQKRGEYGKRRSQTPFADWNQTQQMQIHAYHLARIIVTEARKAVPKETLYHAVSVLRRLSPKKNGGKARHNLLALGEEKQMRLGELKPAACGQFVTEVKQIISKQREENARPRIRVRDFVTFWDPHQRELLVNFIHKHKSWLPLVTSMEISADHLYQLNNRAGGLHIEDYEGALVELEALAAKLKKQRQNIYKRELSEEFTKAYRVLREELIH